MWNLYHCFKTVMSSEEKSSNWWVFGSKLSARKRPLLFPVRDSLVCGYLSNWGPLEVAPTSSAGSPRTPRSSPT